MLMKLISYFKTRRWTSICLLALTLYGTGMLIDYLALRTLPTVVSMTRGLVGCFLLSLFLTPKRPDCP